MSKAEGLLNIANKTNVADDFVKAGNHFIIEDKYGFAAEAYDIAGNIYMDGTNNYQAANMFVKAADNYVKDKQYDKAQDLLNQAINFYLEDGKFASAAKQFKNLGDLHCQCNNITLAIDSYEKSCKWFCNENSKTTGYGILYKTAELAILDKKYDKAISLLTQVDEYYASNKLTEFKCKQLFLEISILKLYSDECEPYFFTQSKHKLTREYQLIDQLIKALNKSDREQFNEARLVFNAIQPLEGWKSELLNEIEERT